MIASLPFLAVLLGVALGAGTNIINQKFYNRRLVESGRKSIPEARLPPMMFGSVIFAAGLFMWAWTSDVDISPIPFVAC